MSRPITRRGIPASIRFIIALLIVLAAVIVASVLIQGARVDAPPRGFAVHTVGKLKGFPAPKGIIIVELPTLTVEEE